MLFGFFSLSLSLFASLGTENITKILDGNPSKRVIFLFFHPNCIHCQRAKPKWNEFAKLVNESQEILAAEVNCQLFGSICNKYRVQYYPYFLYYDMINDVQQTLNTPQSAEALQKIISIKINAHYQKLNDFSQFTREFSNTSNETTSFILRTADSEGCNYSKLYSKSIIKQEYTDSKFYLMNGEKTELSAHRHGFRTHYMNISCDQIKFDDFITRLAYPVLPYLSNELVLMNINLNRKLVLIILNNETEINEYKNLADDIIERWQFSYILYNNNQNIIKNLGIEEKELPAYAILVGRSWHRYIGELNDDSLSKFEPKVTDELYLIFGIIFGLLIILFIVMVVTTIYFCCCDKEAPKQSKKKKKLSYSSDTEPLIA